MFFITKVDRANYKGSISSSYGDEYEQYEELV